MQELDGDDGQHQVDDHEGPDEAQNDAVDPGVVVFGDLKVDHDFGPAFQGAAGVDLNKGPNVGVEILEIVRRISDLLPTIIARDAVGVFPAEVVVHLLDVQPVDALNKSVTVSEL